MISEHDICRPLGDFVNSSQVVKVLSHEVGDTYFTFAMTWILIFSFC